MFCFIKKFYAMSSLNSTKLQHHDTLKIVNIDITTIANIRNKFDMDFTRKEWHTLNSLKPGVYLQF